MSTELTIHKGTGSILQELAATANREHEATNSALAVALEHAFLCGTALLEAHRLAEEEGITWENWVNANLLFGPTHVSNYIRFAYYRSELPSEVFLPWIDKAGHTRQPSLTNALGYVKGLPRIFTTKKANLSAEIKEEVRFLRKQGLTYDAIGELMGINGTTAHRICNPEAEARHKKQTQRRQRTNRSARVALRQQQSATERGRAAKATGDARGEAYSLIRRAAQKTDEASMATSEKEVRSALRDALTHLHRAEDAIARALKCN
jgi:hypothetical protein